MKGGERYEGLQTILCPEMFSINFWHHWKMGMLTPHIHTLAVTEESTEAFGERDQNIIKFASL